jgi:FixJ family two-component response regulator
VSHGGRPPEVEAIVHENYAMHASLPFLPQLVGEDLLGVDLAVRLRSSGVTISILVIIGTPIRCAITQAAALGSVNLVEMPPDEDEVLPVIREAQRGRRGMSNARAPQLRGFASAGDLLG